MNVWHDLELLTDKEDEFQVVIEIPAGSKIKYEIDKEAGLIRVDRILSSAVHYPCNYGLFPKTYCDDKDPLDVLVLGQFPVVPMAVMIVRPVGVVRMIDGGEGDDKVIAVHVDDPEFKHITKLSEVSKAKLAEIKTFFETYKLNEKKSVQINGIDDEVAAMKAVKDSIVLYKELRKNK